MLSVETEDGPANMGPIIGACFPAGIDSITHEKLFEFNCERVHLWLSRMEGCHDQVWFVSELIADPASSKPWKTFGAALKIAHAYATLFQIMFDLQYWWVPNFSFNQPLIRETWREVGSTYVSFLEDAKAWFRKGNLTSVMQIPFAM